MVTFYISPLNRIIVNTDYDKSSLFQSDGRIDFGEVSRINFLTAIGYLLRYHLHYMADYSSSDFTLYDCQKLLVYLCKIINTHSTNYSLQILNLCDFTNRGFVLRPSYFDLTINPQRYEDFI